ncbi:MAG: RNA polymerase sigma factor [Planctomycetia bacterium]|nr:RNA polymerase sigma factor [Planctomycetia bacterium]
MGTSRKIRYNLDTTHSDEELFELFRSTKNTAWLEQLVYRYEHDLYNYLRRFLGDSQYAEDVFQATFLQIFLKADQFDTSRKFRPWLYMVATNQAIDMQRRNKRFRHASLQKNVTPCDEFEGVSLLDMLPGEAPTPEERAMAQERANRMHEFIDTLPHSLRDVVMLIYYEGVKYREAAEVLGVPVGTVKSRLHNAMKRIGAWLRATDNEDSS